MAARHPLAPSSLFDDDHGDWTDRWAELGERIQRFTDDAEVDAWFLQSLVDDPSPRVLAFVNAHAMNCVAADRQFYRALVASDVLLRDGIGLAIHYRLRGRNPGLNLNGTDLIPLILARFNGQPVALLGTEEPYLSEAAAAVSRDWAPNSVVMTVHGFHDASHYVDWVVRHRPRLVILGMGMPKQERVAIMLREVVDFPCLIVCGGAILDFLGGKVQRAPAWMRHSGQEWLFRLVHEPRRLFRRYVLGNPLFMARSVYLRLVRRR